MYTHIKNVVECHTFVIGFAHKCFSLHRLEFSALLRGRVAEGREDTWFVCCCQPPDNLTHDSTHINQILSRRYWLDV